MCVYPSEAATVQRLDFGIRALQLLNNLKALVELREHVHHGAGEQSVLRCLLKLRRRERHQYISFCTYYSYTAYNYGVHVRVRRLHVRIKLRFCC